MKKLISVLLVFILVSALFTCASAAGDGSITVSGTTSGKTYDVYKIFDLTYSGTAPNQSVAYTIDSDWVNFFVGTGAPGASYLLTAQPSGGSLNQLTYNGKVYFINITADNVAAFAQAALAWCADNTPAADGTKTASGTSLKFDGLDLGYYLVYPQGAADISDTYASICSLDSTLSDAEVVVKATYPEIVKTADKESVEVGEVVTFTVTGKVPDTTGYTSYDYTITDTMTSGLTFNDSVDNISVSFDSTSITVPDTGKVTYTIANNGYTLSFDMTKYQDYKGKTITVAYQAVVNPGAVATLTENKAKLTYSNDPADSTKKETTPEISEQVYTSKIIIDKYDAVDTTKAKKLSGAQFVLVNKSSSPEIFYKYTPASSGVAAKVEWVTDKASATVVTTAPNGAASFEGLKDGTYYLRETKSPAGYNLLTDDTAVTVTHTTNTDNKPIGVSVTSEVANKAGIELPSTGGTGSRMLVAFGSFLFAATAILLVTKKRMYNQG